MDLIRRILLAVEEGNANGPLGEYPDEQLKYHRALAIEAKLVKGSVQKNNRRGATDVPFAVRVTGLTWDGHEFIDKVRGEPKWKQVKAWLRKAGEEASIETVKIAVTASLAQLTNG